MTRGPGPHRRAPRRALGRQGDRLVARASRSCRSTTCRGTSPRSTSARLPSSRRSSACSRAAATRCSWPCGGADRSSGSARRSTTPPARRSTRAPGCSGSRTRAAPRSTRWPGRATPRRSASRWRACPGLDFSFSGVKTSLLYTVRDLGEAGLAERRADLAASYQRAIVRALTQRLRAGRRGHGHRSDRRRRGRGREHRAPRGPAGRGARAALALHRQRRHDRLRGPVRRPSASRRGPRSWMRMRRLPERRSRARRPARRCSLVGGAAPGRRGERRRRRAGVGRRRLGEPARRPAVAPSSAGAGSSCSRSRRSRRGSPRPAASRPRSRSAPGRRPHGAPSAT